MRTLIRCIETILVAGLIAVLMMAGARSSDAQPRRGGGRTVHSKVVKKLPRGHATLRVRGDRYFYNKGVFYGRSKGGYRVVHAPVGAVIRKLPRGYKVFRTRNRKYFRHNGVFYTKARKGYRVITPPWSQTTYWGGFGIPGVYFGMGLMYQYSHPHKTYRMAFNHKLNRKRRAFQQNRRRANAKKFRSATNRRRWNN
ncbi:MAG: hypothetical protein BMS9Abin05_1295 [Rhodothermia bacterium]|nr:MAG: hypothetical protein BMS9Abin05_1295 [Rhodothermia bacterium]